MARSIKYQVYTFLSLFLLSQGCATEPNSSQDVVAYTLQEIPSPGIPQSSEPNLYVADDNNVYLTWIEERENHAKLFVSTLQGQRWSAPSLIEQGTDWFVNWADFPSITRFSENALAANYLVKSSSDTYAYDVHIRISEDFGSTWPHSIIPHNDSTKTEHGFVSLIPHGQDLMAIWLDGRKYNTGEDEMTLRAALVNEQGAILQEYLLDDRVCDCCPTSATSCGDGIAVVYRDRSENEIRDINIVRFNGEHWNAPLPISHDHWHIDGCPVNGPAISSRNETVAVSWFSAAGDTSRVHLSISRNGGESFDETTVISESNPIGRVDVCIDNQRNCFVSWIEETSESGKVMVKKVSTDGQSHDPIVVSSASTSRASGMPKMVSVDNRLILAWTEAGSEVKSIRTTEIIFPE